MLLDKNIKDCCIDFDKHSSTDFSDLRECLARYNPLMTNI